MFATNAFTGIYKERTADPWHVVFCLVSVGRVVRFGEGKAEDKGHI